MIGGVVIEIIELADRLWINCREELHEDDPRGRSQCAIWVENNAKSRSISEGDFVWWQGDIALWTPDAFRPEKRKKKTGLHSGMHYDIQLKKIGNSGAARPLVKVA